MKILILNGNPDAQDKEFENYIHNYSNKLQVNDHQVTIFNLRDLNINYCTGCWSCWLKTPGHCIFKDDAGKIYQESINSDLMILASPLLMGFPSSILKKFQDRLIPLIHPYLVIVNNEFHHRKRYKHYPDIGVILKKEKDTDWEDLDINYDIYRRFTLNFRSRLKFLKYMNNNLEEVISETCYI